ncbi:MAG: hypothetical protein M1537_07935 [Nitrospirae bacterium]|nr:MAG: hypothetical protein D084_Lepto4C00412G0007 [Leptospirillum sp. Group IV 'UBA BS']MCL4486236.1 hypothetical protein [Nitrospirota bacterium]MCL5285407.1 hypothetical protein [Nitrospirota bacterium]
MAWAQRPEEVNDAPVLERFLLVMTRKPEKRFGDEGPAESVVRRTPLPRPGGVLPGHVAVLPRGGPSRESTLT